MGKPNWLNKKQPSRTTSDKKVKKLAKDLGGRTVANSGATNFSKGDLKVDNFLVEHKYTDSKSFKLNVNDLHKIYVDAAKCGKNAMFIIEFTEGYHLVGTVTKKISNDNLKSLS